MEQLSPILDFAFVMGSAAVVALILSRFGLPLAPGYILTGLVLSVLSESYGLVQNFATIEVMSQLGMVLLLFTIGLQFSIRRLRKAGLLVILIGVIEVSICLTAGYWLGIILGWSPIEAIALGGVVSISSTVIIVRTLQVVKAPWSPHAHIILGVLIVEDAVAIIIITFFSSVEAGLTITLLDAIFVGLRIILFVVVSIAIGIYVFPSLVDRVVAMANREVLLITILGMCFGMAAFAHLLGFSTSIGAFVMGIIVGSARRHKWIMRQVKGIRDFFVAMFFITIGFFVTPNDLLSALPVAAIIIIVFITIKFLALTSASIMGGRHRAIALRIAFGMLAMGEFSFVIAQISQGSGLVDQPLLAIAVMASLVTSALLPTIVRSGDRAISKMMKEEPDGLQTYCNLTAKWYLHLSSRLSGRSLKATQQFTTKMVTSIIIIVLVVSGVTTVEPHIAAISSRLSIDPLYLWIMLLVMSFAILLIQAVVMARRIKRFIEILSGTILKTSKSAKLMGRGTIVHVLNNIVGLVLAVVLMVSLTLVIPFFQVPLTWIGIVILVLLVIVVWLLEDSIIHVNRRVEKVLSSSFKGQGRSLRADIRSPFLGRRSARGKGQPKR